MSHLTVSAGSRKRGPVLSSTRRSNIGAMYKSCILIMSLVGLLSGAGAMANQSSVSLEGPPKSYAIDDVSVRVHIQGARGLAMPQVTLNGNGTGTLERDQQTSSFAYPSKDLLRVVNALYRIRFFGLHDDPGVTYSVLLRDDGMVVTQALKMSDVGSTRVCFSVGSYEKCVSYVGDGPAELNDIVRTVVAQAERLAGVPAR